MRISYHNLKAIFCFLVFACVTFYTLTAYATGLSLISINQLKLIIDNPEIVIIDVRSSEDWQSSDVKIKGAVRGAPKNFESWAHEFSKDKVIIIY